MIGLRSTASRRAALVLTAAAAVALVVGLVWDRSPPSELSLPPWPAGVGRSDEYAFGDAVGARDLRAWGPVFDALAERYGGKARLRLIRLTLPADADLAALRRRFDEEMVDHRRWRAVTQEIPHGDAWAHGYESPDGRDVFMLVGIDPRPGETLVPLNVLTTIPGG
ncbi:twin-arginine translocation signal domain-containing protein [Inquilinus limosus]|uniref:twin-arginine translocation signal domain-containing protein n=1 Tax=Inquilinus limosus TaxID=171674 RepID=UPI00138AEBAC|nr:twin-arginine translocation signal domain-containing protein [Inquilinus limosus]